VKLGYRGKTVSRRWPIFPAYIPSRNNYERAKPMRVCLFLIAYFCTLSVFSSTSIAADCSQLKIVNRVAMQYGPEGRQIIVPVTINGTEAPFLVDTGGVTTSVSRQLAKQLDLPTQRGSTAFYGVTGIVSYDFASVNSFSIGRLHGTYEEFPIFPGLRQGGVLSLNFMQGYDIDFDFVANVMNFFSQDHCPGAVAYWTGTTGIVPITMRNNHMTVPVTLDGHEFTAIIDTGAPTSTLRMDIAQSDYALTMGSADTPEQGVLNGDRTLKTYHHVFSSLAIGDIVVSNADMSIIPDAMDRNAANEIAQSRRPKALSRIHTPEILIGMDVLRKLHVYVAFGEQKLYVSAGGTPAVTPSATPAITYSPAP
jgi:predicted aspartyl protease